MTDLNSKFAQNGAGFAMELLSELVSSSGMQENMVFSPFSLQVCMGLAFAGVQGSGAVELADKLKFVSSSHSDVAKCFRYIFKKLLRTGSFIIANKAYIQKDISIKYRYERTLKLDYLAEVESIDFGDNLKAANAINSWVESKTDSRIKNFVTPEFFNESSTRLVLLNALAFNGKWQYDFEETDTVEDDFWINENEVKTVAYMNQNHKFDYADLVELECTAVELPYIDEDLSLLILLPNKREGLKALLDKLKTLNVLELTKGFINEKVILKLPKFKVNYFVEMSDIFKKLGLTKIFDGSADFSSMLESAEGLAVSKIFHKVSIDVNEKGTDAYACSGGVILNKISTPPKEFIADHPFIYFVWNKRNIVFAGTFVNPTS